MAPYWLHFIPSNQPAYCFDCAWIERGWGGGVGAVNMVKKMQII